MLPPDYEPGMVVRLDGLKARADLNGQWGMLLGFDDAKGRWNVRIEGSDDMAIRVENLLPVSQEEYDAWAAEQGQAELSPEEALKQVEDMLKHKTSGGATRMADAKEGPLVRQPGPNGNDFDLYMSEHPDPMEASTKVADLLKEQGVCVAEANAPYDLLSQAYEEAEKLYKGGSFQPPMQDMGATEIVATIWQNVLYQDEKKACWLGENCDAEGLKALGLNMQEVARNLLQPLSRKLKVNWNAMWDGLLTCYTGNQSYNFHLDNPSCSDESSLPDNGIRLSVAYFINPHWNPERAIMVEVWTST
jgi:hypothetical protein